MSLVTWDSMLPDFAPYVPKAPYESMRIALKSAAADFLARSYVWTGSIDTTTTVADTAQYSLSADAAIEDVIWLAVDGSHMQKLSRQPSVVSTIAGRPVAFWMSEGDFANLTPTPDDAYALTGVAALRTSRTASGVESWIYNTYGDALINGAAWHLMRIPDKSWSDLQRAHEHKTRFDRDIANAKVHVNRSVPLRVKTYPFA